MIPARPRTLADASFPPLTSDAFPPSTDERPLNPEVIAYLDQRAANTLLADANFDEAGGSWGRKTLESVELASLPAPDDSNDRYDVSLPQVTWTGPTAGQNTAQLLVCYDSDTSGGTDANIIPLTAHVFAVTADGNDVVLNSGVFFRAS